MLIFVKRIISSFSLFLLLFLSTGSLAIAKADELVIQPDGSVILLITNGSLVLAETPKEKAPTPPQQPAKVVPLVAPHVNSNIKITPPPDNSKKVKVTITPAVTTPTPSAKAPTPIVKTVDQVVAQDTKGSPVITVNSGNPNSLTIKQGNAQASTSLPLQFDTATHSLSVPQGGETTRISVLPQEAVVGAEQKGIFNKSEVAKLKIDLTSDSSGINYVLRSERTGKLFGTLPVSDTEQVKLSAQTGTVSQVQKSLLFSVFGGFIK